MCIRDSIWIAPLNRIIRIPIGKETTFADEEDRDVPGTPEWMNDEWLRGHLKLGGTCAPPIGGVAKKWEADPAWRAIGCREWWCGFDAGKVGYQEFERGYIVASLPTAPKDSQARDYYVDVKDRVAKEFGSARAPALCQTQSAEQSRSIPSVPKPSGQPPGTPTK